MSSGDLHQSYIPHGTYPTSALTCDNHGVIAAKFSNNLRAYFQMNIYETLSFAKVNLNQPAYLIVVISSRKGTIRIISKKLPALTSG